ncbi:MAG TPA: hypothetical protein VN643_25920 [Pyrinomonadaceae bacterium]|nr:hypothetical protein [Pyrinomonadaceae bacterium]
MSANVSDKSASQPAVPSSVPKQITNAQTVCNERNEKGKLCNGHLKQLKTAGEPAEVHLRGDNVLSKCQTCGTLYVGPPLGHVRDPGKQKRFVEAELTALLQAAGGTLPVVKKNDKGVFVIVDPAVEQPAAKPAPKVDAAAKVAAAAIAPPPKAKAPAPAAKAAGHKLGENPNRALFKRSTYAGVVDTGPVAGETFEQKVERLRKVSAGAKQRSEEGGGDEVETLRDSSAEADAHRPAAEAQAETGAAAALSETAAPASPVAGAETEADLAAGSSSQPHKPTGQADRALMKRSTYCGVKDTGPVPGETFEQKVARLAAVSAAAKQRSEGG